MSVKSINTLTRSDIENKIVFVRVDFNCPLEYVAFKPQPFFDDTRIKTCLPTIAFLRSNKAKIILCSHLGRPNGKVDEKYSLKPIAEHLRTLVDTNIILAPDCIGPQTRALALRLNPGDILMLENLRFYPEEEANDDAFAASLASLSDGIYVNEAFAASHRAHASIHAITRHVRVKVAGLLMKREVDFLNVVIKNPKRPLVALVGGAKLTSKIPILLNLLKTCDKLILGGGMCFTFMKAMGLSIGRSLFEDSCLATAALILDQAKSQGLPIVFPVDFVVSDSITEHHTMVVDADDIPAGWIGMDIGPRSITLFQNELTDSRTIFWNGPLGVFELPKFAGGTFAMVDYISSVTSDDVTTVVGGGDTVRALTECGLASFSHVSTGGGASLEMLEGKTLPGVLALEEK